MKKILIILFPIFLGLVIYSAFAFILSNAALGKGALQVTSLPPSNVYINGKFIGKTPLCKCEGSDMLATGTYQLKLLPIAGTNLSTYEQQITIVKSVLTVVDRTFGLGAGSSGSVITLKPINDSSHAVIVVSSLPIGLTVLLDSNMVGTTPVTLQDVTDSDHDLLLSKPGYVDKTIHIHSVKGYELDAQIFLGIDLSSVTTSTTSATVTPTVTPSLVSTVTILQTSTGFLRVRFDPTLTASEEARVNPGATFTLVDEQDGWYEIQLKNGATGWISSDYAKKN